MREKSTKSAAQLDLIASMSQAIFAVLRAAVVSDVARAATLTVRTHFTVPTQSSVARSTTVAVKRFAGTRPVDSARTMSDSAATVNCCDTRSACKASHVAGVGFFSNVTTSAVAAAFTGAGWAAEPADPPPPQEV